MIRTLVLALLIASVTSCGTQSPQIDLALQPLPEFPFELYQQATAASVYEIDDDSSRVDIVVRRGGKLERFGHDHVVSTNGVNGYILFVDDELKNSRADLLLNLNSLIVDDTATRVQFDLDSQPTPQDIDKTIQNMHTKVLQTDVWPQVQLKIEITGGTEDVLEARLTVYLHGNEHSFPVLFRTTGLGTDRFQVAGRFSMNQSDYGIQPFSILGGGLQVLDQVDVVFSLVANQLDSSVTVAGWH